MTRVEKWAEECRNKEVEAAYAKARAISSAALLEMYMERYATLYAEGDAAWIEMLEAAYVKAQTGGGRLTCRDEVV
jgi:hypothetical protein